MGSLELYGYDVKTGLTYHGLPVLEADDDFIEHLRERGFDEIDLEELYIEYDEWAKENVDE